ncbi:DUF1822 family protein [Nodosilinea sp. LEGE 07298]|uniref:DUF1822 family protein n=1 Tax=Nodosilinea sp. LEGE 07298 TaxID=2777970 RepID=UPI00187F1CB2|nr:DUF1822 family protein [Nodosilinea sp. LEGE 07298]MBE9108889.1 DUF1822 family protein [Nodosilinea sp. LEGE 07298]
MTAIELVGLPVALDREAHDHAARLAAEQATPAEGRRVYLNTLAVWAVHTYCQWLDIATAVSEGDSWQPGLAALLDGADLSIVGVGRLECRPVWPGERSFTLPPEALDDRIGCVAVQFFDTLDRVELVGFLPPLPDDFTVVEPLTVSIDDLLPLDALLNALHPVANLRQWLEGLLDSPTWQPPEQLLATTRYRPSLPATAQTISQAKPITLGESAQLVVLVVQVIAAAAADHLTVRLRLYPASSKALLPRQINVVVLNDLGDVLLETETQADAVYTELVLTDCQPGEQFSVRITYRSASAIEEFMV